MNNPQEEKPDIVNNIGLRIKMLREKLKITQAELSKRMGFSRNYISLVENGRNTSHRFVQALELLEQAPAPYSEHGLTQNPFDGTPRGLIKARRHQLGLSLDELARLTGYQKSALRNVEEGHTRASEDLLRRLAQHLDLPLEELMGGSDYPHYAGAGHTFAATPRIDTPPGMRARTVPLITWAQAGVGSWEDSAYSHEGVVALGVKDSRAVAIEIRGDSMEPQFKEGTIAIIYPNWQPKNGDLVVARLADGSVMFKRLQVSGDKYTFISLNPLYPPIVVDKREVEKIAPVAITQSQHML